MSFDPKTLTDIPEALRTELHNDAAKQAQTDATDHIAAMIAQAKKDGPTSMAHTALVASTACTFALTMFNRLTTALASDNECPEMQRMFSATEQHADVIIMGGLLSLIHVILEAGAPDARKDPLAHLSYITRAMKGAELINKAILSDVKDSINAMDKMTGPGSHARRTGNLYVMPQRSPNSDS